VNRERKGVVQRYSLNMRCIVIAEVGNCVEYLEGTAAFAESSSASAVNIRLVSPHLRPLWHGLKWAKFLDRNVLCGLSCLSKIASKA